MKLYYSPGACSLSPHIVAREAGLPLTLVRVDTKNKRTETGDDYRAINPKGYVPLLELDDGRRLTEGPAIVQYLADLVPAARLAPAGGTFERVRLQEWLNFITSEIHKQFSPLFDPAMPEEAKARFRDKLAERRDPAAAFDRLDTNKDGAISREEFTQHREERIERRVERGTNAAPGAHRGMRMHRMGGMMGGHMFEMADANKDGRVTLQEATDSAVRHFDMADANRDGRITPEERRQMHRQMIEKRRAPKAG